MNGMLTRASARYYPALRICSAGGRALIPKNAFAVETQGQKERFLILFEKARFVHNQWGFSEPGGTSRLSPVSLSPVSQFPSFPSFPGMRSGCSRICKALPELLH